MASVYSQILVGAPVVPTDLGYLYSPPAGKVAVIKGISVCWGFTVIDVHAWIYTRLSGKICVVYEQGPGVTPGQQQEFGTWFIGTTDGIGVATDGNSAVSISVNGYELFLP
jgi:hypothetical protein